MEGKILNPPTEPQSQPSKVQDIKSAAPNAELVSNIPVQSPASKIFKPSGGQSPISQNDNEFDHVLKDVNASVKQAGNPASAKEKKAQPKVKDGAPKPILATAAACLVALILIAAAVAAYR